MAARASCNALAASAVSSITSSTPPNDTQGDIIDEDIPMHLGETFCKLIHRAQEVQLYQSRR